MKYVKELTVGPSGSGKTYSVLTSYPKPMLVFNFDIAGYEGLSNIKVITVDEFKKTMALFGKYKEDKTPAWTEPTGVTVIDFTASGTRRMSVTKSSNRVGNPALDLFDCFNLIVDKNPYKTIVLDSYSFLDKAIVDFIRSVNAKDQLEIQHWYQVGDKKEEIVTCLLSLECNVVIMGHLEDMKDETTGRLVTAVFGSGKFQKKLPAMFSNVILRERAKTGTGLVYSAVTEPVGTIDFLKLRTDKKHLTRTGPLFNDIYSGLLE